MSIYADKKQGKLTGRWRVEVCQGGQRLRGRYDTMSEAHKAEVDFKSALSSGVAPTATRKFNPDRTHPETLGECVRRAEGILWRGKSVEVNHTTKINAFADHVGRALPMSSISVEQLEDFQVHLDEEGRAGATVNRYMSAINVFLNWCISRKYMEGPPPQITWRRESKGRLRWLTHAEEQRMIAATRGPTSDAIKVACSTGMRRSEILTLTMDNLRDQWVDLWDTKNGDRRSIPISDETHQNIVTLVRHGMPTESQLRYEWQKAKQDIGLGDDAEFVFHSCRHTFATRLVEAEVNLLVIQKLMGHRSIQTTMRYAHVSSAAARNAVSALDLLRDRAASLSCGLT